MEKHKEVRFCDRIQFLRYFCIEICLKYTRLNVQFGLSTEQSQNCKLK